MKPVNDIKICKACGFKGVGNYCSQCGQIFDLKEISVKQLLNDIFRFFTHLEKGFGFTLKWLIIAPGHMQRDYINGNRSRNQKPFAMFFICVTVAALTRYWISNALMKIYDVDIISETNFFHQYMVFMYIALFPVYSLIAYLFFFRDGINYAEAGVLMLYTFSIMFLIGSVISFFTLFWPGMDTAYFEFPVFTAYFTVTFMNYFNNSPRRTIVLKGVIVMVISFFINDAIEKFVIGIIS